jgi:antitoxin ParD1/3/4
MSMSLEVTPEIEEMVHTMVRAGLYENEADVISDALTLLEKRNQLRQDMKQGLLEIQRGESMDGEEVLRELEEKALFAQTNK